MDGCETCDHFGYETLHPCNVEREKIGWDDGRVLFVRCGLAVEVGVATFSPAALFGEGGHADGCASIAAAGSFECACGGSKRAEAAVGS